MKTASVPPLQEFLRYNNWANAKVLKACQKLSDDQLASSAPGTYGSVRDTLEHIIRAEAFYVSLLTGERPQPPFRWEDHPALTEMAAYSTRIGDALLETLTRLDSMHVVHEQSQGEVFKYKAIAVFIQIINHGVEHRTNITTILAQEGITAPEVDGWGYLSSNMDHLGVS